MTKKHDNGKPRWELLPWRELGEVVRAITHGAEKYAPNNWKTVIQSRELYTGAAMRHITAWIGGESRDPESGLHHLAHAVCCLLFLMWFDFREQVVEFPGGTLRIDPMKEPNTTRMEGCIYRPGMIVNYRYGGPGPDVSGFYILSVDYENEIAHGVALDFNKEFNVSFRQLNTVSPYQAEYYRRQFEKLGVIDHG